MSNPLTEEHYVAPFDENVSFDELPDAAPSGKFRLSLTGCNCDQSAPSVHSCLAENPVVCLFAPTGATAQEAMDKGPRYGV